MEAIIFIGIQASGKSTFYEKLFKDTHVRINLDTLKTRHREKVLFEQCLASGHALVIDNTNPTAKDRARYISASRMAKFNVIGYYFSSGIDECITRNRQRPGIQCVPDAAVRGTHARLELPSYEEGFDVLYYVSIGNDGQFVVEEWNDEI